MSKVALCRPIHTGETFIDNQCVHRRGRLDGQKWPCQIPLMVTQGDPSGGRRDWCRTSIVSRNIVVYLALSQLYQSNPLRSLSLEVAWKESPPTVATWSCCLPPGLMLTRKIRLRPAATCLGCGRTTLAHNNGSGSVSHGSFFRAKAGRKEDLGSQSNSTCYGTPPCHPSKGPSRSIAKVQHKAPPKKTTIIYVAPPTTGYRTLPSLPPPNTPTR